MPRSLPEWMSVSAVRPRLGGAAVAGSQSRLGQDQISW
ncbi:hypothetical protein JOH50_006009 [Rhizobium leguminosarum]|nr:hypothetical protein [Rhizobium leguminosarum]